VYNTILHAASYCTISKLNWVNHTWAKERKIEREWYMRFVFSDSHWHWNLSTLVIIFAATAYLDTCRTRQVLEVIVEKKKLRALHVVKLCYGKVHHPSIFAFAKISANSSVSLSAS